MQNFCDELRAHLSFSLFLSRSLDVPYNHETLTPAPQSVCVHIYNYLIINS